MNIKVATFNVGEYKSNKIIENDFDHSLCISEFSVDDKSNEDRR